MKKLMAVLVLMMIAFSTIANADIVSNDPNRFLYATTKVNVRADCNPKATVIGTLAKRERVYGLEFLVGTDGKNWVLAETQFGTGYIREDYLRYEVEDVYQTTVSMKTAGKTTIYDAPFSDAGAIKSIAKGTKVIVISLYPSKSDGTWAKISLGDKHYGYIRVKDLRYKNGKKVSNLPEFVETKRDVKCFTKASLIASKKNFVSKGEILKVAYYVKLSDGSVMAYCINRKYDDVGFILTSDLNKK